MAQFNLTVPFAPIPQSQGGLLSELANQGAQFLEDRQAAEAYGPLLDATFGATQVSKQGGFLSKLLGGGDQPAGSPNIAAGGSVSGVPNQGVPPAAAAQQPGGFLASLFSPQQAGAAPQQQPNMGPTGAGGNVPPPIPAGMAASPQGAVGQQPAPRFSREAIERLLANPATRRFGEMLLPGSEQSVRMAQAEAARAFDERKFTADQDYRRQSLDIQRQAGARAGARLDDNAPRTTTIFDPVTGQLQTAQWDAGNKDWKPIGGPKVPPARPVPAAIQKAEAEDLQDVQTIGQMNEMLGGFVSQIDEGKLNLGPTQNRVSELRNWAGNSDPNSRNYASFQAGLEKMRNESLRLNKGVQTEGDAVRAWNEVFANINDPAVVKQRLGEIIGYNSQAAGYKQNQIALRRETNNLPGLDVGNVVTSGAPKRAAPAGGARSASPTAPGGVPEGATATNPTTGAKVIFRNGQWEPL